jgi:acetyl-CoA C-acetyltransferase
MMRQSTAAKLGCKPLARIVSHAMHAQEPEWFATAPVGATQKALAKAGWSVADVDLWEVNEAFRRRAHGADEELNLRTTSSTSTAAPARWATRSAPAARASWSR